MDGKWIEWMWMWKVESGKWRGSGSYTRTVSQLSSHIIVQILDGNRSLCDFDPAFGGLEASWQRTLFIIGSLESL